MTCETVLYTNENDTRLICPAVTSAMMSTQAEKGAKCCVIESQEQHFTICVLQLSTVFQFPGDHKSGGVLQVQLASCHSVMAGVND